ncbi:MAG: hypothetical protein ACUZ8I_17405 [Candidatus Scalindua sp.]
MNTLDADKHRLKGFRELKDKIIFDRITGWIRYLENPVHLVNPV